MDGKVSSDDGDESGSDALTDDGEAVKGTRKRARSDGSDTESETSDKKITQSSECARCNEKHDPDTRASDLKTTSESSKRCRREIHIPNPICPPLTELFSNVGVAWRLL